MQGLNKRALESFSLHNPGKTIEIPLQILHLEATICPMEGVEMKSGDWIVMNSLPWMRAGKKKNSMRKLFKSVDEKNIVFSLPTSKLKGEPLNLSTIFPGGCFLSFIHRSAMNFLLTTQKFNDFLNQSIQSDDLKLEYTSLLRQYANNRPMTTPMGVSTAESEENEHFSAIKQKPTRYRYKKDEDLKSTHYRRKRQKIDFFFICPASSPAGQTDDFGESLRKLAETDRETQKLLTDIAISTPKIRETIVDNFTSTLAPELPVPVQSAVLMKDTKQNSDSKCNIMAGRNKHVVSDIISLPRRKDVVASRRATDDNVGELFGVEEFLSYDEFPRATCDLISVCAGQIYSSIAQGIVPDTAETLMFKVSFDGSNAGKKDMLVFGVNPLWRIKLVQSGLAVFPISVAWVGESKEALERCMPDLPENIGFLNTNGISLHGPGEGNEVKFNVSIHIAADLSSLWKLCGIGGAANTCSCLFCYNTKPGREDVDSDVSNLCWEERWRTDLNTIFGVEWKHIHICTLHGHTRITEKLLKLVAVTCVSNTKVFELRAAKLKIEKKKAEQEVKKVKSSIRVETVARNKSATKLIRY